MARPDKVAAVADVKDRFESSSALLLTNYRGLTVGELAELRAELRKANATYRVSKNTLIRRAMHDVGVDGLDDLLVGPTALVFCGDDPVGPAKALKAFTKDHPDLEFKGGFLDGGVLDAEAALKLADLDSREDLLTRLAGLMQGALANTARLLAALPEKQAQLLQALVDDGGHAGTAEADPARAAEAEPVAERDEADEANDDGAAAAEAADEAAAEPEPADDSEPEPAAETDDALEAVAAHEAEPSEESEAAADEADESDESDESNDDNDDSG